MSERQVVRAWNVLGTMYPVVRTRIDTADEGECDQSGGEIRISADVGPHRSWEVESHELAHLIAHVVGLRRTLRDVFGLSPEVADKIEEEWIARFVPVYLDTLQRNGCLYPPPAPPMGDLA